MRSGPEVHHDHPPPLPTTWRPRKGRIVPYVLAVAILGGAVVFAVALPPPYRLPDKVGVVLLAVLMAAVLHLLARSRVTADERGLTVVNVALRHRLEWAAVLDIRLRDGEPWPTLDLADGSTLGTMGIQSADGEPSSRAVAHLRALLEEHGTARDGT